jgi:hypothetical protein
MADTTPKITALSKALAFKLNDNVATGNSDGALYPSAKRLDYLNRAYGRLRRTLVALDPELAEKVFKNIYKLYSQLPVAAAKVSLTDKQIINKIHDLYITDATMTQGKAKPVHSIKPSNYLDAKNGQNTNYYNPDESVDGFFYTVMGDEILLLPVDIPETAKVDLLADVSFEEYSQSVSIGAVDMFIPNEYKDMFLCMAAAEAMYDDGEQKSLQKAQAYENFITNQINLIIARKQSEDIKGNKAD